MMIRCTQRFYKHMSYPKVSLCLTLNCGVCISKQSKLHINIYRIYYLDVSVYTSYSYL